MVDHGFFRQSAGGFGTETAHGFRRSGGALYSAGGHFLVFSTGNIDKHEAGNLLPTQVGLYTESGGPRAPAYDIKSNGGILYMGSTANLVFPIGGFGSFFQYTEATDTWDEVGFGLVGGATFAMLDNTSYVIVGGSFTGKYIDSTHNVITATSEKNLIGRSSTGWVSLNSSNIDIGNVHSLFKDTDGTIYVGSTETTTKTIKHGVFTLDGDSSFTGVGGATDFGNNATIEAITKIGSDLIAGGVFTNGSKKGVAKLSGGSWVSHGTKDMDATYAFATFKDVTYACGDYGINKWNGTDWESVSIGGNRKVMEIFDGILHIGSHDGSGGTIARYNGTSFITSLTTGASGVNALHATE